MKGVTSGFTRLLLGLVEAGAFLCILFPLLGLLGRYHWSLDLLAHFRLQYFAILAACTVLFLLSKRTRTAIIAGVAALLLGATLLKFILPAPTAERPTALKIISFNVFTGNDRVDDVLSFLRDESADLVFLMEVDQRWTTRLRKLKGLYPHRLEHPREDNFGVMLLSKAPLTDQEVHFFDSVPVPSVVASLDLEGETIDFIGTHTTPPTNREGSQGRDDHLEELAWLVAPPHSNPLIIAGDLNATPFSGVYTRFLEDGGLRDSSIGFGISPTWKRRTPWFAIPIDHVLVSENLVVHDRRLGPACGSDHNPVIVELSLAKEADGQLE